MMVNETKFHTFNPGKPLPAKLILPHQTHGDRLVEIITGEEDLSACDGVWSQDPQFNLGVKTADCAPICFWNDARFGVIHAGWRGTVNGIIEKMVRIFEFELELTKRKRPQTQIWIGPLLPQFEIQRDNCYEQIYAKFGDQFFSESESRIWFEFKTCLQHLLPKAQFDPRSTFEDLTLSSWRRDKHFENGQNTTVIGSHF